MSLRPPYSEPPAVRGDPMAQRLGGLFVHPSAREFTQAVDVTEFHGTLPDELREYFAARDAEADETPSSTPA